MLKVGLQLIILIIIYGLLDWLSINSIKCQNIVKNSHQKKKNNKKKRVETHETGIFFA